MQSIDSQIIDLSSLPRYDSVNQVLDFTNQSQIVSEQDLYQNMNINTQFFNMQPAVIPMVQRQMPQQFIWNVQTETDNPDLKIKIEDDSDEEEDSDTPNSDSSQQETPQIRKLIQKTTYVAPYKTSSNNLVDWFVSNSDCNNNNNNNNFQYCSQNKQASKKSGKQYQDTKNVPKNFGKAIMKFIKEHQEHAQKLLGSEFEFINFFRRISQKKDKIISIKEFKTLFVDRDFQLKSEKILDIEKLRLYNKVYRILAYKFLRNEFQSYLYANKKIKHGAVMSKYRAVLQNGLREPSQFVSWKIQE